MDDLIQRLRHMAARDSLSGWSAHARTTMAEAAVEIERLRLALQERSDMSETTRKINELLDELRAEKADRAALYPQKGTVGR